MTSYPVVQFGFVDGHGFNSHWAKNFCRQKKKKKNCRLMFVITENHILISPNKVFHVSENSKQLHSVIEPHS